MNKEWAKKHGIIVIDLGGMVGDVVLCDLCGKEWSNSEQSGGFVLSATGVCPDCEEKVMADVVKYKEEFAITSKCPPGMSHVEFIQRFRAGERFK